MSGASNKSAVIPPVPSMQGPAADGTYSPVQLAEYVRHHGRSAAFTISTDGILALASGVELLVEKLTEVAEASAKLRELEQSLEGEFGEHSLKQYLDQIDAAVFGGGATTPHKEDQGIGGTDAA